MPNAGISREGAWFRQGEVMLRLRRFTCIVTWLFCLPTLWGQSNPDSLNLTFTTIDVPGAVVTNVLGINGLGEMVGNYTTSTGGPSHGFLYTGGTFTTVDYPQGNSTLVTSINDSDQVVGFAYLRSSTASVSFSYNGGTFTTIRVPRKGATFAWGINNEGVIVGGDGVNLSGTKGFELIGNTFKNVSPPGIFTYVYANGTNNTGAIVGLTTGGVGDCNGFLFKNSKYSTISFPGAMMTEALGVNDSGIIAGWYEACSPGCAVHAFVLKGTTYMSFDYPGAVATFADGINVSGQIVGSYTLDGQTFHGFVTDPLATELSMTR